MTLHSKQGLALPAAILISGAMISGSIIWSLHEISVAARGPVQQVSQAEVSRPAQIPSVDVANVSTKGNPFVGSPTAMAVMAFWTDYQCPFCRQVETQVLPQLLTGYVNSGKLRIVFKDFQFLGEDSVTAGLASRAVWEVAPERFYDCHKAMFDRQDGENTGWGNKADILALTKTIPGIDAAKVEEFMSSHAARYQKEMDDDLAEGNSFGINGTPGAVIGKQLIVGAQPYGAFKAAVDAAQAPK